MKRSKKFQPNQRLKHFLLSGMKWKHLLRPKRKDTANVLVAPGVPTVVRLFPGRLKFPAIMRLQGRKSPTPNLILLHILILRQRLRPSNKPARIGHWMPVRPTVWTLWTPGKLKPQNVG